MKVPALASCITISQERWLKVNRSACWMILAMLLSSCAAPALGPFHVGTMYGAAVSYGFHPGIDINTAVGSPIIAAADGIVVAERKGSAEGEEVYILHGEHFKSLYAHLTKVLVRKDQLVKRGQLIGLSGATQSVKRLHFEHLHFALCKISQGHCSLRSDTFDPNLFWLGGQPQCFDPGKDYSAYAPIDLTLPVACGEYAKSKLEK